MKNIIYFVADACFLLAFVVYAVFSPAVRQDLEEFNNGKKDIY